MSTVVSNESSKRGLVASSSVWPSFTTTTRFWHLTHHISPLLSLNNGEAQAGQDSSVSVAPFFSKSAMDCTSFDSLVGNFWSSIKKPISVVVYLIIALRALVGGSVLWLARKS